MKLTRIFLAVLAAFGLAPVALAQDAPLKQPGRWAQDYVGRAADPTVRFGTLPNGLRYAIMKNDTPKGAVAMRMLIGSGSLKEREEERGLAHFLEHMAFRGSANVPDGEVVHMLERQGLRFGPDTNASTAFERTLYMFNFPNATADAVDTGLRLFREIGERLKLDPAALEAEKGVVLSEERLRDTPQLKATKAALGLFFAGTRVPDRWPIGTVETIKAATSARLRRYYEANYRPENATIVVVGAIDPAAIEAKIKAGFSDWKGVGPADRLTQPAPAPTAHVAEFVAEGAPDELSLNWVGALDRRAETVAVDRDRMERWLGAGVLNNRLADRALKPGSPFVGAQASINDTVLDTGSLVSLAIRADPVKWQTALDAALEDQRMVLRDGVSADELKRVTNSMLAQYQAAADGAATRRDEALADGIVQAAQDDDLYTSPAQDLALAREVLGGATPQGVTAALRRTFAGSQPLVFRAAHSDPATPSALETALAGAQARALPAAAAQAAASWPYETFGAPGAIVSRRDDAALGATTVAFDNGTRLVIRQSDVEKNSISISVGLGSGQSGVPATFTHAMWASAFLPAGGTGQLPLAEINKWMQTQGKIGGLQAGFSPRRFTIGGTTRPADFAFEMQRLTAYLSDPGFRPEMGDQLITAAPMLKTQVNANPGAVFARGFTDLVQGNDRHFSALPSDADIDATKAADLPVLLRPQLGAAADVVIVGDIPVDEAIRVTAATLGAIPRAARGTEPDPRVDMPAGRAEPYVFPHNGRADQAFYGLAWPLPDFFTDPKLSRTADVTAALIKARLVDTVREKLGLTYSPDTAALASTDLDGLGYLTVQTETPPDRFEAMRAAVLDVIAKLARDPIGADELDRARKPLVEAALKARETNRFWMRSLGLVLREPRARDAVLNEPQQLGDVTAQDVQALLARYVAGKTPTTAIARIRE